MRCVATLITGVGLYGLTVDAVVSRTKKLAIRLPLGADRSQLVSPVMPEALYLVGAGIAFGLALTFVFGRAASSMLVSVSSRDPLSFAAVKSVFFVVLLGAAFYPALRATRLDPIRALRTE
jgi:putative ABC transport system permease protein